VSEGADEGDRGADLRARPAVHRGAGADRIGSGAPGGAAWMSALNDPTGRPFAP
jgi:hypothetical protein